MTPEDTLDLAHDQLEEQAGFTYRFSGSWEFESDATGSTEVVRSTGTGELEGPDEVQHTMTADDGSRTDLIILSDSVWTRSSAFPDQIELRPWADVTELGPITEQFLDPRALLDWMAEGTNPRDGGEDDDGHPIVRAEVPSQLVSPAALGLPFAEEQTLTSELEVAVDESGLPIRIAMTATTQTAVVELVFDQIDEGDEVGVQPPLVDQEDLTPFLNEEDIAVVQGADTLGLAGIPDGWLLVGGSVRPDPADPTCAAVELSYLGLGGSIDPELGPENFIFLHMAPLACAADAALLSDPNFSAGDYDGVIEDTDDGRFGAVVADDLVVVLGSSLSVADLEIVLATLGPVDLTVEPEMIDGIPSEPA